MPIFVLLEFLTAPFKRKSQSVNQEQNDMTPEQDAFDIWSKAGSAGMEKYIKGSKEHGTQFWTAGAGWYAQNLRDEQLDLISYLHHLHQRIKLCQLLAKMMAEEEVSLRDASILLSNLVSDNPPQPLPHQSND